MILLGPDDGWFLRIAYRSWRTDADVLLLHVRAVGGQAGAIHTVERIRRGRTAFWLAQGEVESRGKTLDVDQHLEFPSTRPAKAEPTVRTL